MLGVVREMVSKEKRRYQVDGYDLDLTYMGDRDRIVAMGFPSESVEAAFRNPMKDVLKLLDTNHKDHYRVYNLCSERGYDVGKFHSRVGIYPFDDHNAPPFEMIGKFCQDVELWLSRHEENIAVIHCKAGKGRTGLMICAWFLYSKLWPTPDEALKYYAASRTYDQKGVTIPSQLRYVRYFHESLSLPKDAYYIRHLLLTKVIFHTLPKTFSVADVDFKVYISVVDKKEDNDFTQRKMQVFHYKQHVEQHKDKLKDEPKVHQVEGKKKKKKDKKKDDDGQQNGGADEHTETAEFDCGGALGGGIPLNGDVKLDFEQKGARMFMFWFNTYFVKDLRVIIDKSGLDKAHKDVKHHKLYNKHFKVEMQFTEMTAPVNDHPPSPN